MLISFFCETRDVLRNEMQVSAVYYTESDLHSKWNKTVPWSIQYDWYILKTDKDRQLEEPTFKSLLQYP